MAENDLLSDIAAAYFEVEGRADEELIKKFCAFGNDWLQKKGVVGVGQTMSGFAIRFADASERLLSVTPAVDEIGGAVSISGTASKVGRPFIDSTRSVNITGR